MIQTNSNFRPAVYSKLHCKYCQGSGVSLINHTSCRNYSNLRVIKENICWCVLREIFKIAYGKLNPGSFKESSMIYRADFCIAAKEGLSKKRYEIFKLHFLEGLEASEVVKIVKIRNYRNIYHEYYAIMELVAAKLIEKGIFPMHVYKSSLRKAA